MEVDDFYWCDLCKYSLCQRPSCLKREKKFIKIFKTHDRIYPLFSYDRELIAVIHDN